MVSMYKFLCPCAGMPRNSIPAVGDACLEAQEEKENNQDIGSNETIHTLPLCRWFNDLEFSYN